MTNHTLALNANWDRLGPVFLDAVGDTFYMVIITMLVGGLLGLAVGVLLYTTRQGGILQNRPVYWVLNILVNFIRPIPFIILIAMFAPITLMAVGTTIGREAATFIMSVAATFAVARIVEQNLVSLDPGVIEAARAMGASPWRIITTVILPETLGPLVLGYTFIFIAVIDMSAMAGYVGGGGLGNFAITQGYQRYDFEVMYVAVIAIVIIVQAAQLFGNWLSKKIMRR